MFFAKYRLRCIAFATSRADTAETRIASCVIAALIAHANRKREKVS